MTTMLLTYIMCCHRYENWYWDSDFINDCDYEPSSNKCIKLDTSGTKTTPIIVDEVQSMVHRKFLTKTFIQVVFLHV